MPVERKRKMKKMPVTNIQTKEDKYSPLVNAIRVQGWNITPLIVITIGIQGEPSTQEA